MIDPNILASNLARVEAAKASRLQAEAKVDDLQGLLAAARRELAGADRELLAARDALDLLTDPA